MRQLFIESLVLALVGGSVAMLPALWGIRFISSLHLEELPNAQFISLNWRVLAFNLGLSVLTGCLFAGIPAFAVGKTNVIEVLKATGPALGGGAHQKVCRIFVVGEIVLTLVLLVGAGFTLQSFLRFRSATPGYDSAGLVTMRVALLATYIPARRAMRVDPVLALRHD